MNREFAVIFDIDGVLIDSVEINWQAYNQVLEEYNCHIKEQEIHNYVGMSLKDQVKLLNHKQKINIDYEEFEHKTNRIKDLLFQNTQPKEGAVKLLEELEGANIAIAAGTSLPREIAHERLFQAHILKYFDICVVEEDVELHKPYPDVYLLASEKLGVHPDRCIVIEASPAGIQAAKQAHMKCIAVKTPYVAKNMLDNADKLVTSLENLSLKYLSNIIE